MNVLLILIPSALVLGRVALLGFFWALRHDQFDDPERARRPHPLRPLRRASGGGRRARRRRTAAIRLTPPAAPPKWGA